MDLSEEFEADVNDASKGVALDLNASNNKLLVCFGGLMGGMLGPPFEFLRTTESIATNRIFVRDLEQCWYQKGVQGLGTTVEETTKSLESLVRQHGSQRTLFAGTSSGGFAALLFGSLIGVDTVLAFAPQTFVTAALCMVHRDRRWGGMRRKARRSATKSEDLDVKPLLEQGGPDKTLIYVGVGERRDMAHVNRLRGIESVTIVEQPGDHLVVKEMRDNGALRDVIEAELTIKG